MNMMFSRLLVARQLLRNDGVIFISIGDNEVHNLRRLCNEVFGEENFISTVVWEKRYSPQNAVKWFSESHYFVIVYAKNKLNWYPNLLERSDEMNDRYRNPDNDPRGVWKPADATAQSGHGTKSQFYVLTAPNGKQHTLPNGRCWLYTEPVVKQMIADNRIWFGADGNNVPAVKRFLSEVKQGIACQTIWKYVDVGHNQEAKQEINDLFPESSVFDTPKPVRLLKRILQISTNPNDLILDFFGGSGTTGQAVMELNEADGGNRKFILVQLPELTDESGEAYKAGYKRISDITIERNKRVVNRMIEEKRAAHPNLFEDDNEKAALKGLGFKVFKLESSYFPRTEWNPDPAASEAENVATLKKYIAEKESQLSIVFDSEKLLTEILLKEGFKLNYTTKPYETITTNNVLHVSDGDKETLICLDDSITPETVEHFKAQKGLKFICLERALDTTKKWNLANNLGEKFKAF
jgi:adenine-specific DNA-methyltransferase